MVIPRVAPTSSSKIFSDPLVVSALGVTLSCSFWLTCSYIILSTLTPLALCASASLATANLFWLGSYIWHHRSELYYETSLLYGIFRNYLFPDTYSWWNKIDDHLYVGAIPLHQPKHLEQIPQLLGEKLAILSILEPFELEDKYVFTTAVAHKEWQDQGIETLQLPALDCAGVNQETIVKGIQFIRDMHAAGRTVYVHCKAGVGRSATIVACKILQDGLENGTNFHSTQDAIQYIRNIRNQVTIYKGHARAAIETFFANLKGKR